MAKKGQGYRDVSKFKPEYCDRLVLHRSSGYSYETFAAIAEVAPATLYNWEKTHPEWLEAKKRAQMAAMFHWEGVLIDLATGKSRGSTAACIFSMCNMFREFYTNNHVQTVELPPPVVIRRRDGKETIALAAGEKK